MIFSKVVPRPLGMLKQVFLGRFEPVVARFGPWKIPKCLENGPFWDQQWVKNGSKPRFSKNEPGPFMMLQQVFLAHFEPVATGFGSWKIPKCLENGPFWDQKWVKKGSKTCFSKSDPRPFGMLKQVFLARFEPVLIEFSPFHHMYAPLCALRTYLRAVWWSHLELGEGCQLEDIYIYIYIYCLTVRTWVPLDSRKGQRDCRDPCVHHPKAQSQSHSKVQKQTGGQTSPPSFISTPDPPVPALRGWQKPLYNNNISSSVNATSIVASAATLLLVWCGCAVAGCGRTKAGTSTVHDPHRGLATPTHPPTPPPFPPFPFPLCLRELGEHFHVAGIPRVGVILSSCAERAGHERGHQGHAMGQRAQRAKRFEHEAMAPGTQRETTCGTNRTRGTRSARTCDLVRQYPSLVIPPLPP